ncbi:unnamed protein product [Angiostrongylus costaricensis]|uniref:PI3K/PI4K domain-containing protein n=1 Tax=Angiostrongylus costaricensis TaxID=334426 RepID=A0A0R3PTP1_ANGCS|nr:unnamed protein product [Angiostrongylus costaricensis]
MMSPSVLPLLLASYSAVRQKLLGEGGLMMGLRPSLFHLLLIEMPLTDQWFISKHPALHHCLDIARNVLYFSHDYFLSNSNWLVQSNSPSCMYAEEQLQAIDLKECFVLIHKFRELCVDWLYGLLSGIDENIIETLCCRPEFVSIRSTILAAIINGELYGKYEFYISFYMILTNSLEMGQFRLQSSSFGTDDFMTIIKFLIDGIVPSMQRNQWFYLTGASTTLQLRLISYRFLLFFFLKRWRRLLTHAANYCIENRMKTPLGKPMDTFNKLELLRLAKEVVSGVSSQAAKVNHNRPSVMLSKDRGTKDVEDGLSLSRQFFATNMVSCQEWLFRTYPVAMIVAYHNGYYAQNAIISSDISLKGTIDSVSANLRILGLLAKHADFLHDVIDQGLRITNEHLWKDILPQLFARLSHPVKEVRQSLLGLLSKLCCSAPHTVVFQAVAGSSSSMLVANDDDVLETNEKDYNESSNRVTRHACPSQERCRVLVSVLEMHYPELVKDVREFVNELQRINLLNEERWMFVLANLDHEMEKRLDQIRTETEKTVNAVHLDEKTRLEIIVYRILDDLYERTCLREPTTQNERMFVQAYGEKLQSVFEQSRANRKSAEKSWAPFKHVHAEIYEMSFHTHQISPILSELSKSRIPIPGQENMEYSEVVTIDRVLKNVLILPTKTRPKKIAFVGSEGKEHIFLFKGQEDLHLDERIMQLLHICNLMLAGGSSKRSWPPYCAHHYAVTPLGTRSGLIQWVSGATPMFHIYRKWQLRQVRTSSLWMILIKAQFAKNVETAIIADRSKWPQNLLREVFDSLIKETPKDLISRELWMRSGSCDTWWRVVCRYARSTAVMSMIGAILGLGDRHLDNVLVNLDRGDVVHIDYNICFDKGKHLRVPETVPFRLTQNILHALGPTQGVFRESCSQVLSTLREGREVLLTVLDAFVYDPLVDWAVSDHLTASSAAVGVAVTLAVYGTNSRAVEAKPVVREMFSKFSTCNDALQERVEAGRRLKSSIARHHNIIKDFRPLLKCDDRFVDYIHAYRVRFSEPLVKAHQLLDAESLDLDACLHSRPHHKQQQEQNVHANNVVRRVRARLEGRTEPSDPHKIVGTNEQVR